MRFVRKFVDSGGVLFVMALVAEAALIVGGYYFLRDYDRLATDEQRYQFFARCIAKDLPPETCLALFRHTFR